MTRYLLKMLFFAFYASIQIIKKDIMIYFSKQWSLFERQKNTMTLFSPSLLFITPFSPSEQGPDFTSWGAFLCAATAIGGYFLYQF